MYISNTSTSSNTTSDSKVNKLKVLRTFNLEGTASLRKEKGNGMES
jgi:hypothetical protein